MVEAHVLKIKNIDVYRDTDIVVKFFYLNENGKIAEIEDTYLTMINDEINKMSTEIFERAFVTNDPLIYKTKYYTENSFYFQEHLWGFTIMILPLSTDSVVNNIRNNIINLLNEGYLGFHKNGIDMTKIKLNEPEEINEFVFIKTDQSKYQVEQKLLK